MTPDEFRIAGHDLIDWIAAYRERIGEFPVQSQVGPGEVRAQLPGSPPSAPEGIPALIADLDRVVLPGITHVQHPMHFGWFPSNASLASVLGDLASTGIGALGITWQSAPALTEVEEVMMAWLRDLTGLSGRWHGTIHDTSSTACLVAMLLARERARGGEQSAGAPEPGVRLAVYTSPQAHSSVMKAAALAGYGRDGIREVETDRATYAMRPESLAEAMKADVAAGIIPAAVVATVGTTGTTAIDPVAQIVGVAVPHGAWVHVDAAMAGSAMLLPECRHLWEGVEDADSLAWNPHKWMGTAVDTAAFYVRDLQHLIRVMSTNPSYLRSAVDGEVTQYRDWGIPLGRRFRALKLWFHLRIDGVEAIRARLRRDMDNASWLRAEVEATRDWRVLAPVPLQTVCIRHEPAGLDDDALDRHTLAWVDAINRSGVAHLTPSILDGRWMARVSVGVEATERNHVVELWSLMRRTAEHLPAA